MLTPKQIRILSLLANGYNCKEISNLLDVSYITVKNWVGQLRRKMLCRTKEQMVAIGIQKGIVKVDGY